MRHSF